MTSTSSPMHMLKELDFGNIYEVEPVSASDLKNEDIVIVLMGPTGAGKSTFVQTVTEGFYDNDNNNGVGHNLRSATSEVSAFRITFKNDDTTNLVLVDTPGFDDTYTNDYEILEIVVKWLNAARIKDSTTHKHTIMRKISGILYLHRITDIRFTGGVAKNFELFRMLCGEDFFSRVILTTTMWPAEDKLTDELKKEYEAHEQEMKEDYWKVMIESGAKVHRFMKTLKSAEGIVNELVKTRPKHEEQPDMQIQRELEKTPLWETLVGRYLRQTIQGLFGKYPSPRLFKEYDFSKIRGVERVYTRDMSKDDMIVVVMGPPGTGKSTFIRTVVGDSEVFRHGTESPMNEVTAVRITFAESDDTNLVLVDTPGFGHVDKTDPEILEAVARWFKDVGVNDRNLWRISGIIYLHPVTDIGVSTDTIKKNLEVFRELCGKEFCDRVILTTTMWPDKNDHTYSIEKEQQCVQRVQNLKMEDWRRMIAWGAEVMCFNRTPQSTMEIINRIVAAEYQKQERLHERIVQIQRELVREFKSLPRTQAGRRLRGILQELARKQKREIKLRERVLKDSFRWDSRLNDELQRLLKEKEDNDKVIRKLSQSAVS